MEPVFSLPRGGDLRLDCKRHGPKLADHLAFQVTRAPHDLGNHVRRVLYCYEAGDSNALCAALIDLNLALGSRGHALRLRLLEGARSKLDAQHYRFLADRLETGVQQNDVMLLRLCTRLCRGILGETQLLTATQAHASDRDPLLEAREFLEYSDIAKAQEVLETAIVADPARAELHYDLLEIYSSTRDRNRFIRTLRSIPDAHNPLYEVWEAVGIFLYGEDWDSIQQSLARQDRDPLVEAREYLEYSQIEKAREVLESALLRDPQRADLHAELLDIYRSTRDRQNLRRFLSQIDPANNPLVAEWEALAASVET